MSDDQEQKPAASLKQAAILGLSSGLVASVLTVAAFLGYQYWNRAEPVNPNLPNDPPPVVKIVSSFLLDANGEVVSDSAVSKPIISAIEAAAGKTPQKFVYTGVPDKGKPVFRTLTIVDGIVPGTPSTPVVVTPKPDEPLPQPPPAVPVVDPSTKATAVTYIFEKDQGGVPNHVSTALNKINRDSKWTIEATIFEDDSTNGNGDVPKRIKSAYDAAKKEGLPVVVVTAGDRVLKAIKAPKTEAEILEAVK